MIFCLSVTLSSPTHSSTLSGADKGRGGQRANCPPGGAIAPPWEFEKGRNYGDKHWKKSELYELPNSDIKKNIHRKKESKTRLWRKFYVLFVDFISFIFPQLIPKKVQRQNCLFSFKSERRCSIMFCFFLS